MSDYNGHPERLDAEEVKEGRPVWAPDFLIGEKKIAARAIPIENFPGRVIVFGRWGAFLGFFDDAKLESRELEEWEKER